MLINTQHLTQPVWHTASSSDVLLGRVNTLCVDGLHGYAAVAPIPSMLVHQGGSPFDRNTASLLSGDDYGIERKDLPIFASTKNWHKNDERSGSLTNEIDQQDLLRLIRLYRQRWKPDGTRGKPKTPH
jgi:hypothetical protein